MADDVVPDRLEEIIWNRVRGDYDNQRSTYDDIGWLIAEVEQLREHRDTSDDVAELKAEITQLQAAVCRPHEGFNDKCVFCGAVLAGQEPT